MSSSPPGSSIPNTNEAPSFPTTSAPPGTLDDATRRMARRAREERTIRTARRRLEWGRWREAGRGVAWGGGAGARSQTLDPEAGRGRGHWLERQDSDARIVANVPRRV